MNQSTSLTLADIAQDGVCVHPHETAGHAAELLRTSTYTAIPVVAGDAVVGIISEERLMHALHSGGAAAAGSPELVSQLPAAAVMTPNPPTMRGDVEVATAAEAAELHNLSVIPVVDDDGAYLGIVGRADLISALTRSLRPQSIGGMATPLGVYLTTGHVRAGASDLGLVLTGVALGCLWWCGHYLVFAALMGVDAVAHTSLARIYLSPQIAQIHQQQYLAASMEFLRLLGFLLLIRSVPLSGYHAAEHQVVHAIERGEPLALRTVRCMPRAHPRCGTNIVAFLVIFGFLVEQVSMHYVVALGATFLIWRGIGMRLQELFTTRPANDRQLQSGIEAGSQLLANYRRDPRHRAGALGRLWNMGLLQIATGMSATTFLFLLLHRLLGIPFVL